jgi:hypothetical protein
MKTEGRHCLAWRDAGGPRWVTEAAAGLDAWETTMLLENKNTVICGGRRSGRQRGRRGIRA